MSKYNDNTIIQFGIHKGKEFELDLFLFEEDDIWVCYCPALELSSYGDSKTDAKTAFDEALDIFFEETSEKGTLEQCLKELGWEVQRSPVKVVSKPSLSLSSIVGNYPG